MSDDSLKARLAALASEQPEIENGARVLRTKGAGFETVITVIDETVLGERMVFSNGEAKMTLLVAGRRLAGLEAVEGVEVAKDVLGAGLTMDNPDQVKRIAETIEAFAGDAATLTVATEPFADAEELESVSLNALVNASGIDPNMTPMQRFLSKGEPIMSASILLENGAVSKTNGAIQSVQSLKIALSTQLQPFLDARKATCPSHSDPSLTLCQDTIEQGVGIAIALHGDDLALVAFKSGDLAAICAAWQKVV